MKNCFFLILIILQCSVYGQQSAMKGINKWDEDILLSLEHSRTPFQTDVFRFVSRTNDYVCAAVPVGLFAGGIIDGNKQMRQHAALMAGSTIATFAVNALVKKIFKRPRPFQVSVVLTPVYRAGGFSFPSGHAASSFNAAVSLSRTYPKWYIIATS